MKIKALLIAFVACLCVQVFTSCTNSIDAKLTAFEKSIDKLKETYKDLSPQALEKAVASLEKRLEKLKKLDADDKMSINQKKRFIKLKVKYYALLADIKIHTSLSDAYDSREGKSVIDYLDELTDAASANANELLVE